MSLQLLDITDYLKTFAPLELAESWDNVGLLLGDDTAPVERVMTCLTLTHDVAAEAVEKQAQLIISHHPVLFRPIQKITSASVEGRLLLNLMRHGIAVYSPHTAFDSARAGINQLLATRLGLMDIQPLRAIATETSDSLGAGRWGNLTQPCKLEMFLKRMKLPLFGSRSTSDTTAGPALLQWTGDPEQMIQSVGVACGAAGEFLKDAARVGCQLFITGETRFHTHVEARELGMAMVLVGHYTSERPAVEMLAQSIQSQFPELQVWASQKESDPVQWSVV